MTDEQKAAYIIGMASNLFAKVIGMQAENMQRQALGQSMAYVEEDFVKEIQDSGCYHNAIMGYFQN